jgi:hypothetical protein
LSAVNARTCAAYVKHRGNRGGARRDLETFRAAINHHGKEGLDLIPADDLSVGCGEAQPPIPSFADGGCLMSYCTGQAVFSLEVDEFFNVESTGSDILQPWG